MIVYRNESWFGTVFTYTGSVWPNIRRQFLMWIAFVTVCYGLSNTLQAKLVGVEGHTILGGAISFLLIFRTNTAYKRYWTGRTSVSIFFDDLRDLLMISLLYIGAPLAQGSMDGGKHSDLSVNMRKLQVNVVRLTVALALTLKMYTRIGLDGYIFGSISRETKFCIDWDRFSLMQLLDDMEFEFVDSCLGILGPGSPIEKDKEQLAALFRDHDEAPEDWPEAFEVSTQHAMRMHVAIVYMLREQLVMNMNDLANQVPWGIKERFVPVISNFLKSAQSAIEMVSQIVTTPLPLPYACLCKTLLTVWMGSYPFVFDYRLGYFGGAVIPTLVAFALLGVDAIATELENPFGDDANDLDLIEQIHTLEGEAMEMLDLYGESHARKHFVWRRLPAFIAETSCKPVYHFLAVTEFATEEVVPAPSVSDHRAPASERSARSSLTASSMARSSQGL